MKSILIALTLFSFSFLNNANADIFASKDASKKTRKVSCAKNYSLKGNKNGYYCEGSKSVGKNDTFKVKCPIGTKHQSLPGRDNCKGLWDTKPVTCDGLIFKKKGKVNIVNDQVGNDDYCTQEASDEARYKKPKFVKK